MMYGMKFLIHSKTSTVVPLKFGIDKQFHLTLKCACDYLSLMVKLTHVCNLASVCEVIACHVTAHLVHRDTTADGKISRQTILKKNDTVWYDAC